MKDTFNRSTAKWEIIDQTGDVWVSAETLGFFQTADCTLAQAKRVAKAESEGSDGWPAFVREIKTGRVHAA